MGGFLIIRKDAGKPISEDSVRGALHVFEKKGLATSHHVVRPEFDLYLYRKLVDADEHLLEFDDGGFVASTGSLIYKQQSGIAALAAVAKDFNAGFDVDKELLGNYCVILYCDGRLTLLNDRAGYYRVYHDLDHRVISSSFLAVAYAQPVLTVSPNEFYEYVFYGFFFSAKTVFEQVRTLNHDYIWRITPDRTPTQRTVHFEDFDGASNFTAMVEVVRENLLGYFHSLSKAFGGSFTCALSGGYDSRLMVALLRYLKVNPHIYVYGSDNSDDVRIAKKIAQEERFPLDHVDKKARPSIPSEQWRDHVEREFFFFDGVKPLGIFDNGADRETRLDRASRGRLQLNGAGGEIYREIWNLPNRSVSVDQWLRNGYDFGQFGSCTDRFSKAEFFDVLSGKIRNLVKINGNCLNRKEVEMLFPLLRNRFATAGANNQFASACLPYVEPRFTYQSYEIPIRFKNYGRFHSALIESLDPQLASYDSSYGIRFTDPVTWKTRVKTYLRQRVPIAARVMLRGRRHSNSKRPQYLQGEYYSSLFGGRDLAIRKYLDPDAICDPEKLLRAFSAELVIGDYFGRSSS